ncbi:hypothetical protein ES703_67147 [subsurface metagenome]
MNAWIVKTGNTSQQDFEIQDKNGKAVIDLASAVFIKFQVKRKGEEKGSPIISKVLGDGIEVDTPTLGCLRITLLPSDTSIRPGERYIMGCEINWGSDENYEVFMFLNGKETNQFVVVESVIS